ncbi:peptidoglycan-binding domain-containing protein [Actinoplanes sp. NPDC023801]|uniref:peptidoglycan-binding domain-containing protein n=1 Tax=Actinoplanes sp. NPDC023801 TaxID=3154595 RepID=UPI0033D3BA2D
MSTRMTRRAATVALMAAGFAGVQLVSAGAAAADPITTLATPTCSKSVTYQGALVPAASNGSVTCNMVRGNVSDGVLRLQDTMNDCYRTALTRVRVYPLSVDGNFGGNTEKALREVQRVAGTGIDGQYGPNTRKAMLHVDPNFGDPCRRVS